MSTQPVIANLAEYCVSQSFSDRFLLTKEKKDFFTFLFQKIAPHYEAEFKALENQFTNDGANKFLDKVVSNCWEKFKSFISQQNLQTLPPILQKGLIFIYEGRFPTLQEMESIHKELEIPKILSKMKDSSLEECRKFLKDIPEVFDVKEFLTFFLRESFADAFPQVLLDDSEKGDKNSDAFRVLNRLIKDYISQDPCKIWKTHPQLNYAYKIPLLDHVVSESLYNRIKASGDLLHMLESVLDGIEREDVFTVLFDKHLGSILYFDTNQVFKWAQENPKSGDVNYGQVSALTAYLLAIFTKINEKNLPQEHDLFTKIAIYVLHEDFPELQLSEEEKSLHKKILEIHSKHQKDIFAQSKLLRDARDSKNKQKGLPLLGIGFSGPSFEERPLGQQNKIFLNFTSQLRSKRSLAGLVFLQGVRLLSDHLAIRGDQKNSYQIHVLDHGIEGTAKIYTHIVNTVIDILCETRTLVHKDLVSVFQEALIGRVESELKKVMDQKAKLEKDFEKLFVGLNPKQLNKVEKSRQDLALKESELQEMSRKIDQYIEIEKILISGQFCSLNVLQKEEIKKMVLSGETRECVETVITQFSGNSCTLSWAMGNDVGEPVRFQGAGESATPTPYTLGNNRVLTQPCLTRCQLMGAAHTLWGELQNLPSIQQAHDRDLSRKGEGIQSSVSAETFADNNPLFEVLSKFLSGAKSDEYKA